MPDPIVPAATPPAGTPPAAAPGTSGGAAGTPWYSSIENPELRGYAESKGFKDPASVLDSYRNLEKLQGVPKERLLKLPDKDDSPEWNEVHARLGRPEKAEGYDIKAPEGSTDEFAKWSRDQFHAAGLSKKQGQTLATKWNERVKAVQESETARFNEASHQQHSKLKEEWGAAFDQNVALTKAFASKAGIDTDTYVKIENAIGVDGAAKLFHGLIEKFGIDFKESGFQGGGDNGGFRVLSPDGARARIQSLLGDPAYSKRYIEGGTAERAEMARLHEWAAANS